MRIYLALAAGLVLARGAAATTLLSENFDEPGGFFAGSGFHNPSDPPIDWHVVNNSSPQAANSNSWFDAPNPSYNYFPAQSGANFAGVDADCGSNVSTLSDWLITPQITFNAGDQVSFYTRSKGSFPDRLQLRLSTNGTSFNVGSTATSTGDFSTLLLDINPTYKASNNGGYPATWTQYTISLPTAGSGRLAFRYFVEDGGPGGDNSDFLGVDTLAVVTGGVPVDQWAASTGGSWNNAANWSGGIPNAAAAKVGFSSSGATNAAVITLDGNVTVGQMTFNSANAYSIAQGSSGTLTLDDTGDTGGAHPAISVITGGHSISAPINLAGGLAITTAASTSLNITGNITGSGDITIAGAGSVTLRGALPATAAINANGPVTISAQTSGGGVSRSIAALNIASGVTATVGSSNGPANPLILTVPALSFDPDGTSKLDLTTNGIITAGTPDSILELINSGELFSSSPDTTKALGYTAIPASANMKIRLTLKGDANVDGTVDVGDLGALATNYGVTFGAFWTQGDFNYDGVVDVGDLGALATNYGTSIGSGPAAGPAANVASTAVPEPAMMGLWILAAARVARRRRR